MEFRTISAPVEDILLKEKGSKFIGFAAPIANESDLKSYLEKIRALHPKASHHCFAFRLGFSGENYRANDDGEPSGSAGLPIYNQLLANEITNIVLIVVRYFGGTKLGVSGLVKAYKECAKLTLENAEIITKEPEKSYEIVFPYEKQHLVFALLNRFEAKILDLVSDNQCTLSFSISEKNCQAVLFQINEIQNVTVKN